MRKLLVTLDDEISPLLAKYPNQSETVREALKLYIGNITPDRINQIIASYEAIVKYLKEIDSKLDYAIKKKKL